MPSMLCICSRICIWCSPNPRGAARVPFTQWSAPRACARAGHGFNAQNRDASEMTAWGDFFRASDGALADTAAREIPANIAAAVGHRAEVIISSTFQMTSAGLIAELFEVPLYVLSFQPLSPTRDCGPFSDGLREEGPGWLRQARWLVLYARVRASQRVGGGFPLA